MMHTYFCIGSIIIDHVNVVTEIHKLISNYSK